MTPKTIAIFVSFNLLIILKRNAWELQGGVGEWIIVLLLGYKPIFGSWDLVRKWLRYSYFNLVCQKQ